MEWKKICCGIDYSAGARLALVQAATLASRVGAELTLLHVVELPAVAATTAMGYQELFGKQDLANAGQAMAQWRADAQKVVGREVHAVVVQGGAAKQILAFTRERGFDLIVLGSHGRGGLKRLVLGSVAERVVREAPCPVLVVRPREEGTLEISKDEIEQYRSA